MKSIHPFGFYVFRKPLLPINTLLTLLDNVAETNDLETVLRAVFEKPDLQEAIYCASPHLYDRLTQWLQGHSFSRQEAFHATLLKYLIRASTRCTPYGKFAGCLPPGYFQDHTCVSFHEQTPHVSHNRLRTDCLAPWQTAYAHHPVIRQHLTYTSNDSLYQWGDQYRYTFYRVENDVRQYALYSVDASPYIEVVLGRAKHGATLNDLVNVLIDQYVSPSLAESFVHELIDEQVLVSELRGRVTGDEALTALIHQLTHWEGAVPEIGKELQEAHQLLNHTEAIAPHHRHIVSLMQNNSDQEEQHVVHTDLFFNTTRNSLSQKMIQRLGQTLNKLQVLDQGNPIPALKDFSQQFHARYGEQEIPLLQALDAELGIGYDCGSHHEGGHSPLLVEVDLATQEGSSTVQWNYWKDFVLRKYTETVRQARSEIILDDSDLLSLEQYHCVHPNTPTTSTAFGNLLATSAKAIDQGDFQFHLYQLAGPSGSNLLGRFCYGDHNLQHQVKALVEEEERAHPEVIFAEVAHLPDEREGMVASRPTLRRYEIPFLTQSSVDSEHRILLSDLMISVKNGQHVILRSQKHNRRVIPRLSVAHNFHRGHPVYRFLGDLQFDEQVLNVRWHWGVLEKQHFLPRVSYQNVILSRATWTLVTRDYPKLKERQVRDDEFRGELLHLPHFPRYVQLIENDNELLIDTENPHTLKLLKEVFRKKEVITLKECLQLPPHCFLNDQAGCYTNEIIIPFVAKPTPYQYSNLFSEVSDVKRCFTTGSEWFYIKLYTGKKISDKLIGTALKELADNLLSQQLIDQWFFIRYADPDHHLRIRFHKHPEADSRFYTEFLPTVYQWVNQLLISKKVRKVQTDTYQREIERYGVDTIEASEALFFYDSQAVASFLASPSRQDETARWQFAFAGIDYLLNDFCYTLPDKLRLLGQLKQAFFNEFAVEKALKRQMDVNYRKYADETVESVSMLLYAHPELEKLLRQRSATSHSLVADVAARSYDLDQLLASYIHMFMNRLFASNQRQHELLAYYYLWKYYRSAKAKKEKLAMV